MPDSSISRKIKSKIVAMMASFCEGSGWDKDDDNALIARFLKWSASTLALTNRGDEASSA